MTDRLGFDEISVTEGKIAFLRHTFRNTSSRPDYLQAVAAKSLIHMGEAGVAWDIFHYLAWEEIDERNPSNPPLPSEDPETDHGS